MTTSNQFLKELSYCAIFIAILTLPSCTSKTDSTESTELTRKIQETKKNLDSKLDASSDKIENSFDKIHSEFEKYNADKLDSTTSSYYSPDSISIFDLVKKTGSEAEQKR